MPTPVASMPVQIDSRPPTFNPRKAEVERDDDSTGSMDAVSISAPPIEPDDLEEVRRTSQAASSKVRAPTPGHPSMAPSITPESEGIKACTKCGADVPTTHLFCGVCGTRMVATAQPKVAPTRDVGHLALIDDLGGESVRYPLIEGDNAIGRGQNVQVPFAQDGLLASTHCVVVADETPFRLRPVDFCNGTYLRISTPVELQHGDIIRVGQEVLRFERIDDIAAEVSAVTGRTLTVGCPMPRGVWGRLCQVGMARQVANAYLLSHRDVFLGRERGDILFPKDGFVSGSHAVISERGGRVYLKDLGSSNGTFLRIKREIALRNGDLLLLGRNLLRVHVGAS